MPRVQLALDFLELKRAVKVAKLAVPEGIDVIEAGTPLIKSEGLEAVRVLRKEFPGHEIVADMKTMDAGRAEMEIAAKAGANFATVMGAASVVTIAECVEAGRNYGIGVGVDLLGIDDPKLIGKFEEIGVSFLAVHIPIDDQMKGLGFGEKLRMVLETVRLPVRVAGGLNSESVVDAANSGAETVIVGGAIIKANDPAQAARDIKKAIVTRCAVKTELFRRATEKDIRETLMRVSAANASDGMHRGGAIHGIRPLHPDFRAVGPAVTVRTMPGDWAKPVEAIDEAAEGDVLVIDAGGVPPAMWGELATHSARQKKLAGVVIHGAARDTADIIRMGLPVFARHVCPNAGEPKGLGEIGAPLKIDNIQIAPGDWIVADNDGVVAIPKEKAVEYANRAQDVLELENRLRTEINEGSTLAYVANLLRWEKTR